MAARMKFTDQLRQVILAAPESQGQLCKTLGIDPANMSRFTRGESGLSLTAIDRLCEYFDLRLVGPEQPKRGK
jgi:hypothetical protein